MNEGPRRILVVDDDLEVIELSRNRLQANHFEVLTAADGVEGMALAREHRPDLIVLDIMMPNMDGYTFVQEIKRMEELRHIPILVVTAKDEMKELFIAEGVSHFLLKPFKTEVFLEKVQQLTQK